ncbi:lysozyme, partial [Citrobacter freundii]|nr:lysozyme [Citrobacter freundii]
GTQTTLTQKMPQIKERFQQEALIAWMLSVGISRFCAAEFCSGVISQPETF